MPVSTSVHISQALQYIISLEPKSVLDVGCGFGLWGFLCRMHLDVARERVAPETWQIRIDAIEYFAPYIQSHHRALYSSVKIGDIRALAPDLDDYDLIIAGDVIEHLEHDEGEIVLDQLYQKARKALIVCIPLGLGWDHPARHGNPQEEHRSIWTVEDFAPYPAATYSFTLPCGDYGLFVCLKDIPSESRENGLMLAIQTREEAGRLDLAALYARRFAESRPNDNSAIFIYADLLLRNREYEAAIGALRAYIADNAGDLNAIITLARALCALGRKDEARQCLAPLGDRLPDDPDARSALDALRKILQ